ncbi:hypothetical protein EN751_38115, partial [Mesorhizobium sp. M4A.F.Ca.ET.029.04.2.1]
MGQSLLACRPAAIAAKGWRLPFPGPTLSIPKNQDDSATPPAAMLLMLCVYVCFTFLDTSSKYLVLAGVSALIVA